MKELKKVSKGYVTEEELQVYHELENNRNGLKDMLEDIQEMYTDLLKARKQWWKEIQESHNIEHDSKTQFLNINYETRELTLERKKD